MTAIKLDKFGGCLPTWSDLLLPDNQASYARDCYLVSGELTGWRQPKLLRPLNDITAKYVYRVPNKTTNNTTIKADDSTWLEFTDPDTNVVHSPVAGDSYDRFYVASPSQPPLYNTYDGIVNGTTWWRLGIPAPPTPPGVTVDGGGGASQLGFPSVTTGSGVSSIPGNSILWVPIVPQGAMSLQDVSFVTASASRSINYRAVVYNDLEHSPFQLVGFTPVSTGVFADEAAISTFTNSISVAGQATYWIGIMTDEPYDIYVVDGTTQAFTMVQTFSNGPPSQIHSLVDGLTPNSTVQIWADLLGGSIFTARAYVYTWVSAYGEEGPPSNPTLLNGWSNGTWHIEVTPPSPEDQGIVRNIKYTNIYRTISNQQGLTTYFFVAQIPATQTSYDDTIGDDIIASNSQLESLFWFPPPMDLQGIVSYPNGVTVGFRANEVWFSEPYRPHSWPPGYVLTTEFPIVGIGVCGQAVVVCTRSTPYVINGIHPAAMSMSKVNLAEPCLHRGSIISTDTTVLYVSQNGLIQIGQAAAGGNITEGWISRERWQELTPQGQVRAIKHMTSYFAFGSDKPAGGSGGAESFMLTKFNPLDADNIDLSDSNLTALGNAVFGGVRTVTSYRIGKYYWEFTVAEWASFYNHVGWFTKNIPLTAELIGAAGAGSFYVTTSGGVALNGLAIIGMSLGSVPGPGSVIACALDLDNNLGWWRILPGDWNGSPTADPAAGIGGTDITTANVAPLFPGVLTGIAGDGGTANFGASPFAGEVPAGFGATPPVLDASAVLDEGYTVELSQEDQLSFSILPQAGGHRLGFQQLSPPNGPDSSIVNVEVDPWTGIALLIQNGGVWYYDHTDQNPIIVPYKWKSKIFQALSRKNFAACRVWFTVPGTTPPQVARDTSEPQPELGPNQYGVLRVYADGQLYTTREVRKSGELLRFYSGAKLEQWQFEIESRVRISNFQVATSVKELGVI